MVLELIIPMITTVLISFGSFREFYVPVICCVIFLCIKSLIQRLGVFRL